MKIVKVKRRPINYKDYVRRSALESDATQTISGDSIIIDEDTDQVLVIYKILEDAEYHNKVFESLKKVKYFESQRSSGLMSRSRIFGYSPRNRMKTTDQACRVASLAKDQPAIHKLICDYARRIDDYYKANDDDKYKHHKELTEKVLEDYVIDGTLFTSGIVNYNNPLKYHFDAGNFQKVSSAMIAFKQNVRGGRLALPEYNVKLEIEDRSVTLFDGQEALHGVTPIKELGNDAYRYTVVFYSLVGMWQCLPLDEEIADARNARWKAELKKYDRKFS